MPKVFQPGRVLVIVMLAFVGCQRLNVQKFLFRELDPTWCWRPADSAAAHRGCMPFHPAQPAN